MELLIWLLALLAAPASTCEAISGQHADGATTGVVVYGCAPDGVDEPYVLAETR